MRYLLPFGKDEPTPVADPNPGGVAYGCGAIGIGPRKVPGGAVSECGSEKARTKPAATSAATHSTAATSLIDVADGAARRVRPSGAAEAWEAAISLMTRGVARFFRAA